MLTVKINRINEMIVMSGTEWNGDHLHPHHPQQHPLHHQQYHPHHPHPHHHLAHGHPGARQMAANSMLHHMR